jgi:hypothetical protein
MKHTRTIKAQVAIGHVVVKVEVDGAGAPAHAFDDLVSRFMQAISDNPHFGTPISRQKVS